MIIRSTFDRKTGKLIKEEVIPGPGKSLDVLAKILAEMIMKDRE